MTISGPNPFEDSFLLQLDEASASGGTVTVYTMKGEKVKTLGFAPGDQELQIDLSTAPKGTYLIRLKDGDKQLNKRVIKQ